MRIFSSFCGDEESAGNSFAVCGGLRREFQDEQEDADRPARDIGSRICVPAVGAKQLRAVRL